MVSGASAYRPRLRPEPPCGPERDRRTAGRDPLPRFRSAATTGSPSSSSRVVRPDGCPMMTALSSRPTSAVWHKFGFWQQHLDGRRGWCDAASSESHAGIPKPGNAARLAGFTLPVRCPYRSDAPQIDSAVFMRPNCRRVSSGSDRHGIIDGWDRLVHDGDIGDGRARISAAKCVGCHHGTDERRPYELLATTRVDGSTFPANGRRRARASGQANIVDEGTRVVRGVAGSCRTGQ
jgi:hypothetical protein